MTAQQRFLVLFDADRIKEYVFATGRLKEIRGASAQIRALTSDPLVSISTAGWSPRQPFDPIYSGGGAGAFLFDDKHDASEFCLRFERLVRQETGSTSLSAVYVPIHGDDLAAAQTRAAQRLAAHKKSRPHAEQIAGGGYLRFCDSDRLYPAACSERDPDQPSEPALFSQSSTIKRTASKSYRHQLEEQLFWKELMHLQPDDKARQDWQAAISEAQNFEAIGMQSTPPNYIGFLHADGDGMGTLIRTIVETYGLDGYKKISSAIDEAAHYATAHALHAAYPLPGKELPFEVITIGGDDIMLVCTADAVLGIAASISQSFAARLEPIVKELLGTQAVPPSASVGVVIAHTSHPIINMQQRATELLKRAKHVPRTIGIRDGFIDFHIVSSPSLEPIRAIREKQYQDVQEAAPRTMRPYARSEFATLLQQAGYIATIPGSKRAQLYEAALHSRDRISTTLDILRIQTRMQQADAQILLQALNALGVGVRYPFATNKRDQDVLPLADLIEAAEFVPTRSRI